MYTAKTASRLLSSHSQLYRIPFPSLPSRTPLHVSYSHFTTRHSSYPHIVRPKLALYIGIAATTGSFLFLKAKSVHSEAAVALPKSEEGALFGILDFFEKLRKRTETNNADTNIKCPETSRPLYSRKEVSRHTTKEKGIWVIHDNGVYDITEFVEIHPGGERILLAAGRCIDPFWSVFTIHKTPEIQQLLEHYRIGDLLIPTDQEELDELRKEEEKDKEALKDLFKWESVRHPDLIVHSEYPYNAETPAHALADNSITPNQLFYVRNHLPIPELQSTSYRLAIEGPGIPADTSLSLEDLKSLPQVTITATLQCAGNRRKDMTEVKRTNGLPWTQGAIGTARWTGVLLRDVIAKSLKESVSEDVQHVQFHGAEGYGASIPVSKALSADGDVLLAYEMNGEPLPADHGGPIRIVVPGHVAARSVKWVDRITLSDEESPAFWQRRDYKSFSPSVENPTEEDYAAAQSIQRLPVQSAITFPSPNTTVAGSVDKIPVKGYAVSAPNRIIRVDVSSDGGKNWVVARLEPPSDGSPWAWTQWSADVPVPKGSDEVDIMCKAVDESYNTQPEGILGIWNARGMVVNGWHRIKVSLDRKEQSNKEE